jgi:hypothetical protein
MAAPMIENELNAGFEKASSKIKGNSNIPRTLFIINTTNTYVLISSLVLKMNPTICKQRYLHK